MDISMWKRFLALRMNWSRIWDILSIVWVWIWNFLRLTGLRSWLLIRIRRNLLLQFVRFRMESWIIGWWSEKMPLWNVLKVISIWSIRSFKRILISGFRLVLPHWHLQILLLRILYVCKIMGNQLLLFLPVKVHRWSLAQLGRVICSFYRQRRNYISSMTWNVCFILPMFLWMRILICQLLEPHRRFFGNTVCIRQTGCYGFTDLRQMNYFL